LKPLTNNPKHSPTVRQTVRQNVGPKGKKSNKGSSLVEALISVAILSYVVVSILSGFSQQQMTTRITSQRNIATGLAEQQLERMLKFNAQQLNGISTTDYVVQKSNGFSEFVGDPKIVGQYRRTTTVSYDSLNKLAKIVVLIEYPYTNKSYPFKTTLMTSRGEK